MTSRKLVEQTLNFESPERIPRHLWLLPWAEQRYPEFVKSLSKQYPDDIVQVPAFYRQPLPVSGGKYTKGTYIDEWGCRFDIYEEGVMGIVHEPRIRDWSDLEMLVPPAEMLNPDKEAINRFCHATDKFTYANSIIRPFERFQFLRTMEQSFFDVIYQEPGYFELLKLLHDHFCKEVEVWSQTDIDAIFLMDDWGTQQALMVAPEIFRRDFKPMYRDFCEIAKSYGKYVFMHSDGYISEIIEDLIEVGVDALNSQLFCMDMKELSNRYRGRITFWGEIDRQNLLPNADADTIRSAVQEVYDHLYDHGGVIAQCEFGPGAKPENIQTVFETWQKIHPNPLQVFKTL